MLNITKDNVLYVPVPQIITKSTAILSDLDGTGAPLLADPTQRFIDSNLHSAFRMINKVLPGQVIPITGRDSSQVKQCFHGQLPKFPVISSNGAQLHLPNGETITHAFTLPEQIYTREMRQTMAEFKVEHPELVAEVKLFEIGRHVQRAHGYSHISNRELFRKADICDAMMERMESIARQRALKFSIESTETVHREMSHRDIDKLGALTSFGHHLTQAVQDGKNRIFLGDSLIKGNDRVLAIDTNERNGIVCQVYNGVLDRIPPEGDPARPQFAFDYPSTLGIFMKKQAENLVAGMPRSLPRLSYGN